MINWPFAFCVFAVFAALNFRGVFLVRQGYRMAIPGLVCLWLLAALFLDLLRRRLAGEL